MTLIIKAFENVGRAKCMGTTINKIADTPHFWDISLSHWVFLAQRLETALVASPSRVNGPFTSRHGVTSQKTLTKIIAPPATHA
jgi:hypothetical protein